VCTYGINKDKAIKILEATEDQYLAILNGRKVTNFYLSIIGDSDAVCVDGHAYSIWVGERISTNKTPAIGVVLYREISADYVNATKAINRAEGTNYTAAQIQAITWVTHKRIHNSR